MIDIDGTVVPEGISGIDAATRTILRRIADRHEARLASNGRNDARKRSITEGTGIPYTEGKKPFPALVRRLQEENRNGLPFVVIGDRFLTDGLLAFWLEGEFVPVRPLRSGYEPLRTRLAYGVHGIATALCLRLMGGYRKP